MYRTRTRTIRQHKQLSNPNGDGIFDVIQEGFTKFANSPSGKKILDVAVTEGSKALKSAIFDKPPQPKASPTQQKPVKSQADEDLELENYKKQMQNKAPLTDAQKRKIINRAIKL